jgi:hypothetical protein
MLGAPGHIMQKAEQRDRERMDQLLPETTVGRVILGEIMKVFSILIVVMVTVDYSGLKNRIIYQKPKQQIYVGLGK